MKRFLLPLAALVCCAFPGLVRADLIRQSSTYTRTVLMTDSTDHITGKTGLTLTISAAKAGGAPAAITPTVTEIGSGRYAIALTTAHTNTLGALDLIITATGADPSDTHDQIVAFDPQDSVSLGLTAVKTVPSLTTVQSGTAQAGGASTVTLAVGASTTTDLYKGNYVLISGGTGAGQARTITGYNGTTLVATLSRPWTVTPDATSVYAVIANPHPALDSNLAVTAGTVSDKAGFSLVTAPPTPSQIAQAILATPSNLLVTNGTGQVQASNLPADYQQRGQAVTLPSTVLPSADLTAIVNGILGATVDSGGGTTLTVKQSLFLSFVGSLGKFGTAVRSTSAPWTITVPFLRLDGTTTGWTYVTTYTDNTFSKAASRAFTPGTLP